MPSEVKIYECEVKKLFRKDGTNERHWVVRPPAALIPTEPGCIAHH
jgi:hypothetical protein